MNETDREFFNTKFMFNRIAHYVNIAQKKYEYYIYDNEDPRVKNLYLLSSPLPTLAAIVIYLFLIYKFFPKYMSNRKPFRISLLIRLYDIFQVVACSTIVYQLVTPLSSPLYSWKCEPLEYSQDPPSLKRVSISYYFYLIKSVELLETIFFALRKKFNQISYLHVYHHLTTFVMAWLYGKYYSGGMTAFCMVLNSSIHVIMYSYYFLSSLGPKWQKIVSQWKSTITMLQMIQLLTLIGHSSQIVLTNECNLPKSAFYFYAVNVAVILFMFRNFYKRSYKKKEL